MNRFSYTRVDDIGDALEAIRETRGAAFIAGGTNLVDLMKEGVARPQRIVDITRLPLREIGTTDAGGLRCGALVTNSELAYAPVVVERYPLLSKAILAGASPQIRNAATVGGNILQRTRCYYFYDAGVPCNKREPGSGCPALDGVNRSHAILGASEHCIAVHPSDMCVALAALDARVYLVGPGGPRVVPLLELHRLPGTTPHIDTQLREGELLAAIELPADGFAQHHAYVKVRDRASYAFALVSAALALELDGDRIRDVRCALGGVAHKPWRDREAEASLFGTRLTSRRVRDFAAGIVRDARGRRGNAYKIELATRTVVRAFEAATRRHLAED